MAKIFVILTMVRNIRNNDTYSSERGATIKIIFAWMYYQKIFYMTIPCI